MKYSKMFFEDFEIGLVFNTGSKKITKNEIISFAKNYDPQYFHVDDTLLICKDTLHKIVLLYS